MFVSYAAPCNPSVFQNYIKLLELETKCLRDQLEKVQLELKALEENNDLLGRVMAATFSKNGLY